MNTHNIFATQAALAIIFAWFTQTLKGSPWFPWITSETTKLNHVVTAFLAAAASVGITITWTADTHTLAIANITLQASGLLAWNFVKQYAYQHSASKMYEIVQMLQKMQPPKA